MGVLRAIRLPRRPMSNPPEELERAVAHLVALVDAPSVTGDEAPAVDEAERLARDDLGLPVVRMEAEPGRDNLLVGDPKPRVILCTHLDGLPVAYPVHHPGGLPVPPLGTFPGTILGSILVH